MIKIRNGTFETNSSSTHALILTNEQYNEDVNEGTLLTLVNLPELEADISIFTGEKDDRTYEGKKYSVYEGCFTNIVDKIRYIYTCLCQSGLYTTVDNIVMVDELSPAYNIFKQLKDFLPKINFIPPEKELIYIFEDCEYVTDEILDKALFSSIRTLGLFLLKGQVVYCDRDEDSELSDELRDIAKKNKYSIAVSG